MKLKNKGSGLVEVAVAVAVVILLLFGISSVMVNQIRVQKMMHITQANNQVMEVEAHRLRNLPLSSFYSDDDMTALKPNLTYYRLLPMPPPPARRDPATGVETPVPGSAAMYGEINVKLTMLTPSMSGSPVQVTLTVRPVHHTSGAIPSSTGKAFVDPGSFEKTLPNLSIANISQTVTFISL